MKATTDDNALSGISALLGSGVHSSGTTSRQALQRLLLLRMLATVISILGAALFHLFSPLDIPVLLLSCVVFAIALSIGVGFWRLSRFTYVSQLELVAQLLADVAFLVIVLLYTGGVSNPLISYLLVLLTVGATILRQAYVNVFATFSIILYTAFLADQLQTEHTDHLMVNFQLHLVGMWVTFVVSALLITLFVTRMAEAIRTREVTLAQSREKEMRNEQLIAIGTLAAGTAHALGTPLSTMAVLLTELDKMTNEELVRMPIKEDISLLRQQVTRCKESLNQLTAFYNRKERTEPESIVLGELMDVVKDYIVNIHPSANVRFNLDETQRQITVTPDLSLRHAIINLIENAIKASHQQVTISSGVSASKRLPIEILIRDDGPGIPVSVMENMGEPFISTRKDSMGLGIFLANAAIQRNDGEIEMFNMKSGGAMSVIRLPAA